VTLALDADNAGDHRLAGPNVTAGATIDVEAVTLDGLAERGAIDPADTGLVWIDVQGHEGRVLAGARRLREAGVPFATEFAPDLLRDADNLALFLEHAASFRAVVDLRTPAGERPATDVAALADSYAGAADPVTDLLLLP
jgi:hypothetical protein